MKKLITFIPSLVKSGFSLWKKSKEWSAKKRMFALCAVPLALIGLTTVIHFFGADNAALAASLLVEVMEGLE